MLMIHKLLFLLNMAKLHINSDLQICNFANKHGLTLNLAKSAIIAFDDRLMNFDIMVENVVIPPSNRVKRPCDFFTMKMLKLACQFCKEAIHNINH